MGEYIKKLHLAKRCRTQHKRVVPYGTHPNICSAKTSFMLGTNVNQNDILLSAFSRTFWLSKVPDKKFFDIINR
jgi:hypothetical protein